MCSEKFNKLVHLHYLYSICKIQTCFFENQALFGLAGKLSLLPDLSVDLVVNRIEGLIIQLLIHKCYQRSVFFFFINLCSSVNLDAKKPIVVAIEGLALGAGLEVAMVCDFGNQIIFFFIFKFKSFKIIFILLF